ncbi:MAG TPA: hypothetical protein VGL59_25755 [Polyangia bacterium]
MTAAVSWRAAGLLVAAIAGAAGCATTNAGFDDPVRLTANAAAGWQALFDGHSAEAAAKFHNQQGDSVDDLLSAFGRATIAYETGDRPRAIAGYQAVLAAVANGDDEGAWSQALAPVAAGRLLALLQDVPDARDNRAVEDALLSLARQRLPWPAQIDLGRLGDRAARRRRDPELLERAASAAGCARLVYQAGAGGRLPHVDLDGDGSSAPLPMPPPSAWRLADATGCRLSVSSWDGRSGVQILRAAVETDAGVADLVLDFAGEARFRVDGGPWQHHGGELDAGPTVAATAVRWSKGRHLIELRLATVGVDTELTLMLLPAHADATTPFVDPRAVPAGAGGATIGKPVPPLLSPPAAAVPVAWRPLLAYAQTYAADRVGAADATDEALARLTANERFAVGLALAGAVVQNDVNRPPAFARDAAQSFFRRAVTIDASLARSWLALASIEFEDDRPHESIDDARAAIRAAPAWPAPELALAAAQAARGLEFDGDQALDRAENKASPPGRASCATDEALLRRAEQRRDLRVRDQLADRLLGCDSEIDARADRLRGRGDRAGALAWLQKAAPLTPRRDDLRETIAALMLATGDTAGAIGERRALVARAPRDFRQRIALADALAAAGQGEASRRTLADLLTTEGGAEEVRWVARAAGLPLPLDDHRLDGAAVIAAFRQSGRSYEAPAVVVLDRSVDRVLGNGEQLMLTHTIVRVQTKEAIDRWGEVNVPSGAELLLLRTHKPDGTTRDAEAVSGKDSISAADLAVGDFLEWETLEAKGASDAFPGGFLGDRFYFQSFDAPLDRSEFIVITPAALAVDVDRRAGAPAAVRGAGPDGTVVTRFVAEHVPQLFAERASVPAIEFVPSVRLSSGVSWSAWARFLREQIYGTARSSPAIRQLAAGIAKTVPAGDGDPARARAAAIVAWVTTHIEAADDLRDAAPLALARGRGNRLGLVLALARELGVTARPVLARSRLSGDAQRAPAPLELEDFADSLVAFDLPNAKGQAQAPTTTMFADVRLKHASFGYLPPNLDGADTLSLDNAQTGRANSRGLPDERVVDMTIRMDEDGSAQALATEELTGWPALEWAELIDRLGADRAQLRQDFEQSWLGANFPGARLKDLQVDFVGAVEGAPAVSAPAAETRAVRVRYSFVSPNFGLRGDRELKLSPTFFRSQPGRRFAVEPDRHTGLMMGSDVPFRLTATVQLPHSATAVDLPAGAAGVVARKGGYRFVEERTARVGSPEVLILRREAALPLMRVSPEEYGGVAADLRRVDGLEQQEIRIRLQPRPGGSAP